MRILVASVILLGLCGPLSAAWNDKNVEGTKEHPVVKLYPQAHVEEFEEKDFDSVEMVTGLDTGSGDPEAKVEEIEGHVMHYVYEHKPGTSSFEILRQYETALTKAGFVKLLAGKTEKLPSSDKIVGQVFGAFRLDRDGKPAIYVNLTANEGGGSVESALTIVEPKEMEQKLSADADGFYKAISNTGHVAIYGINFDTGKATIRPDSEPVLNEIQQMLSEHGDLKLKVEGHTDNVGSSAANLKLSQARATSVVAWLSKHGIKADRLTASGYGDTKPVAGNDSEDGRAKNRRVELAK